jgi:hypothetical protein
MSEKCRGSAIDIFLVLDSHHQSVQTVQRLYFLAQRRNLLVEPSDLGLWYRFPLAISAVELREISGDALDNLRQPPLRLGLSEVPIPDLTALNLLPSIATLASLTTQGVGASPRTHGRNVADGLTIVLAEVGYRLEVRQ